MLTVHTKIQPSPIAGIGLFANQFIPSGTIIWKTNPLIDILLSKDEADSLAEPAKNQFYNYAYLDTVHNKYLLCGDDGRFFNHSSQPNCDDSHPDITVALVDIFPGDELTVNYNVFYGDIESHPLTKSFVTPRL